MLKEYPFYIKVPVILLGLVISVFILSVLRDILVPLAFAALIAILLNRCKCTFKSLRNTLGYCLAPLLPIELLSLTFPYIDNMWSREDSCWFRILVHWMRVTAIACRPKKSCPSRWSQTVIIEMNRCR